MNRLYGEPEMRRLKSRERLSNGMYCAPQVFSEGGEWPGDWQGRALLTLACHYKMAPTQEERDSIYLQAKEILTLLPEHTNEGGYFGEPFDENMVNEQQLSGNSWFLRGLCMWYEITADKNIYRRLERITQSLLFHLVNAYRRYPSVRCYILLYSRKSLKMLFFVYLMLHLRVIKHVVNISDNSS